MVAVCSRILMPAAPFEPNIVTFVDKAHFREEYGLFLYTRFVSWFSRAAVQLILSERSFPNQSQFTAGKVGLHQVLSQIFFDPST